MARLAATGARSAGPSPLPTGDGAVLEVDRTVNATGGISLANQQVGVGSPLAGQRVTLRMEGPLIAVLCHDGTLLRTLACPIPADRRSRLRGARRARPCYHSPAGPSPCSGESHPAAGSGRPAEDPRRDDPRRQDRHRDLREQPFPVVIDGETAAMVPRTTTSEIHRYKANATDKRYQARLTPKGR